MWILAIIKRFCPVPNSEAVKHSETSVNSMTQLFGRLFSIIGFL